MITLKLITTTVEVSSQPPELLKQIQQGLSQYGEPLRWAITGIVSDQAQIEAVVIQKADAAD